MPDLSRIRKEIDEIDTKLRTLLKIRFEKSSKIKQIKEENNLPIQDHEREEEILKQCTTNYEKKIFEKILEQSRKLQA